MISFACKNPSNPSGLELIMMQHVVYPSAMRKVAMHRRSKTILKPHVSTSSLSSSLASPPKLDTSSSVHAPDSDPPSAHAPRIAANTVFSPEHSDILERCAVDVFRDVEARASKGPSRIFEAAFVAVQHAPQSMRDQILQHAAQRLCQLSVLREESYDQDAMCALIQPLSARMLRAISALELLRDDAVLDVHALRHKPYYPKQALSMPTLQDALHACRPQGLEERWRVVEHLWDDRVRWDDTFAWSCLSNALQVDVCIIEQCERTGLFRRAPAVRVHPVAFPRVMFIVQTNNHRHTFSCSLNNHTICLREQVPKPFIDFTRQSLYHGHGFAHEMFRTDEEDDKVLAFRKKQREAKRQARLMYRLFR